MNDPLIARFTDACGATGPLDLRVGIAAGGVLAEGTIHQPFTLIGRDDACDVTLTDPDVNPRHAWLQVVGGRVYAIDLGSRTGLVWPDGQSRSGWLDVGVPVRVGPFRVHLRTPVVPRPVSPGPDPLHADPTLAQSQPTVQLDFRNGKRAKDRWAVNRAITLIGRAEGCKLHLHADDISAYHCGLVLTQTGLWVVDLSGRGVVVNGERMRVAPLPHGAELWVGRFLIGCHYPVLGDTPAVGRPTQLPPPAAIPGPSPTPATEKTHSYRGPAGQRPSAGGSPGTPTRVMPTFPLIAEDEVPLGGLPVLDPISGLPSSHIMCDAFQAAAISGPISSPILVAGSDPTPPVIPLSSVLRGAPTAVLPVSRFAPPASPGSIAGTIGPLLRQLSDLQGQMFEQFQQSLLLMVQTIAQVDRGQSFAVEQELLRILDLNGELTRLETEVTRLALSQLAGGASADGALAPNDPTPLPSAPLLATRSRPADAAGAIEEWVRDRISALQNERASRWERLTGLLAAAGGRG